jgi:long-chain acyl-CoA synthetase
MIEVKMMIKVSDTSAKDHVALEATCLGAVLPEAAQRFGDAPALFFEGAWSSFRELDRDSNRFAAALVSEGVLATSRVVLHVPNSRDWIVAYYGVAKTGAVVVPVDAMLTPDEVAYIIKDCGATALITGLADPAAIRQIQSDTSLSIIVLAFEAATVEGGLRQSDLIAAGCEDFHFADIPPDHLSSISYTSGSTGKPKGAMLSHRNILLSASLTAKTHGRTHQDVFLSALPCTHVYGNAIIHASMLVGGRFVLLRRFDAETTLEAIATHKVTMFEGVPTMYFRLLSHSRLSVHDVRSLTLCTVGGQSIPEETITEVERVFGCPLLELWGMTELAGPAVTHDRHLRGPVGSIGRPLPGMEARVAPIEPTEYGGDDESVRLGELLIRGPLVMQGYLNRPEATQETIDADGWLHTGDLASEDAEGNLYIVGRTKDIIISAGYNIYPAEVERAISQHPAVAMVAVGKVDDVDKGEIAVAYVVLKPDSTALAGEVEQAARDRLAPYKAPRRVVFVEDLPKTGSGKVMRHRLSEAKPVELPAPVAPSSPNYQFVRAEVKDGIGVVTMHGPKGINALNEAFISEIADALHRMDQDRGVRCMILRAGTLKYFSVGADINEMAERTFVKALDDDFFTVGWSRIAQCRKPLIAAVSGLALGGGCELALMCDIIVASDTAEFGLPEVRLGIFPGAGGTQRLVRQIGKSRAMEMILTGDVQLNADDALALGLVSRVVPEGELMLAAAAVAQKIAANSMMTVRMAKESINRAYESSLAEGLLFERRLFYASLATEDKLEGTRAFLERRPPFFTDR